MGERPKIQGISTGTLDLCGFSLICLRFEIRIF